MESSYRSETIIGKRKRFKNALYHFMFGWKGFLLLLIILLPLKISRAREENSLWIDEVYSLLLSFRAREEIIQLTALDNHPPLYYLSLKAWIGLGERLGWTAELLWARLLNVFFWLLFSLGTWFGGRRLLGKPGGAILAWAVVSGAQVAQATKDARCYALATFAAFTCFLALFLAWKTKERESAIPDRFTVYALWGLYAFSGVVALYSHLLTGFALLLLGVSWIFLVLEKRKSDASFLWGGAIAQFVTLAMFAPWLSRIPGQIAYIQGSTQPWMTPPTIWNLVRIYLFWLPFGQTPNPPVEAAFYAYLAGGLSFVLPWAAFIKAGGFSRKNNAEALTIRTIALFGGGISVLFPLSLFLIRRFAGIQIFHAPRYPIIVAPIWTAALVAAALYSAERWKRPVFFALLLLAPWFLCNFAGRFWSHSLEIKAGLARWKSATPEFSPAIGETLYVSPSELIPYYASSLKGYDVRTIEEIALAPPLSWSVLVLDMNPWKILRPLRRTIIFSAIHEGRLSEKQEIKVRHSSTEYFQGFRLNGFHHEKARALFKNGINPANRDIPDSAVTRAFPENQRLDEGWSLDEVDRDGNLFRWATGKETRIRFDGAIMPGIYTLHFVGYRPPYPEEKAEMLFRFDRQPERYRITHSSGALHIEMRVRITLKHKEPILKVRHPVWRPKDVEENNNDPRKLTFLFFYAWMEPKPV